VPRIEPRLAVEAMQRHVEKLRQVTAAGAAARFERAWVRRDFSMNRAHS
jgi:hypothetical protein